jgi:hypothetical protein
MDSHPVENSERPSCFARGTFKSRASWRNLPVARYECSILALPRVLSSRQARRRDLSVLRRDRQRRDRPDASARRAPITSRDLRGGSGGGRGGEHGLFRGSVWGPPRGLRGRDRGRERKRWPQRGSGRRGRRERDHGTDRFVERCRRPCFVAATLRIPRDRTAVLRSRLHSGRVSRGTETPMKIAAFGANGPTGRILVEDAMARGHTVNAITRHR